MKNSKKMIIMILGFFGLSGLSQTLISSDLADDDQKYLKDYSDPEDVKQREKLEEMFKQDAFDKAYRLVLTELFRVETADIGMRNGSEVVSNVLRTLQDLINNSSNKTNDWTTEDLNALFRYHHQADTTSVTLAKTILDLLKDLSVNDKQKLLDKLFNKNSYFSSLKN